MPFPVIVLYPVKTYSYGGFCLPFGFGIQEPATGIGIGAGDVGEMGYVAS